MKKVYTRFFIYLTCCALVLSFAVAPASATSFDQELHIQNYFDYNYAETFYNLTPTENTITFPLHQRQYVRYVELLIASGQGWDSVSIVRGSLTNELTTKYIGNGFYRVFGSFSGGGKAWDDELKLVFDLPKNAEIQIWSFRYSISKYNSFPVKAKVEAFTDYEPTIRTQEYDPNAGTNPVGPSDVVMMDFGPSTTSTTSDPGHMYVSIFSAGVNYFDYLDFLITVQSSGIESISASCDGMSVPCEISYVEPADILYDYSISFVQIRLDLRQLVKTGPDPCLNITAAISNFSPFSFVALHEVVGVNCVDNQSPTSTWFQRLIDTIKNVFNPDDSAASDAGDKMESAADELTSGSAAFDKVETPDINTGNLINQYVNFNPGGLSILTSLTSNAYVTQMMIVVFTFALCGYIFFGKKR